MKPETLAITGLLIALALVVPRRWVLLPFVAAACTIPMDQRIIIFGLDFSTLRFLVLAAMVRLYVRGEIRPIKLNSIDKLVLAWSITGALIYVLQWQSMTAVIYKSGVLYDCLGMYWVFRVVFRSWKDIDFAFRSFAFFAIASAPLIIYERVSGQSPFALLGRVQARMHHGRFCCAGPFSHFIMMGLFWATLLPIFVSYALATHRRVLFGLATCSALICIFLANSSTPLMAVFVAIFFGLLWRYRRRGRQIVLAIGVGLLLLQCAMNHPIWFVVCKINIISGSTGWHRYWLFDNFVRHASEWVLLGCKGVAHWGIYAGDITNQYVLEGVTGGVLTLLLFIILMVYSVRVPAIGSITDRDRTHRILCWGLCVSVLGHIVAFWGVSYFGQIMILLYLTFAIVSFLRDTQEKRCILMSATRASTSYVHSLA